MTGFAAGGGGQGRAVGGFRGGNRVSNPLFNLIKHNSLSQGQRDVVEAENETYKCYYFRYFSFISNWMH